MNYYIKADIISFLLQVAIVLALIGMSLANPAPSGFSGLGKGHQFF